MSCFTSYWQKRAECSEPENRHKLMNMFSNSLKHSCLVKKWGTTSKMVQEVFVISSTNEAGSNQTENVLQTCSGLSRRVWRVLKDWGESSYRPAVTVLNTASVVEGSKMYITHACCISQTNFNGKKTKKNQQMKCSFAVETYLRCLLLSLFLYCNKYADWTVALMQRLFEQPIVVFLI